MTNFITALGLNQRSCHQISDKYLLIKQSVDAYTNVSYSYKILGKHPDNRVTSHELCSKSFSKRECSG